MSEVVLKVENVSKTYPGVRALDHVSIECRAGEVHAILGENGSGKSTLLKIISGTVAPDGGSVDIQGRRLGAADPRLAHGLGLATVYQDNSLIRELSVAQNLYLATKPAEVKFSEMVGWAEATLRSYASDIPAEAIVGSLTPAQRQFVEIIKALLSDPKVLLLDEPTSTLDIEGVRKLTETIRDLQARGTGIVYVSHRLPEILDLADRVTVLRDGVHQGTFPVTESLSEAELVAMMVGRDLTSEYPPKSYAPSGIPVLVVDGLSGAQFSGLGFKSSPGEILGFAGAEGNGQREALRALGGLEDSHGVVACGGMEVDLSSPRQALKGGVLFLSADRSGEAIFPELAVQKNMTISRLRDFVAGALLSGSAERKKAEKMRDDFGVVAASLGSPILGLSGGNQQKAVLARSFRAGAKVVLIDEPTQGVDAGARFEIYRAIRENIRDGGTCVVNSSDAQELAGICDRVLVFSRGRVVQELTGDDVTEEKIVATFLTARGDNEAHQVAGETGVAASLSKALQFLVGGSSVWWLPLVFLAVLTVLVSVFAATQSNVFLKPINIRHILLATAPAAIVSMAQLHVLLVRGLDVSVGSLMSLTVVMASFLMNTDGSLPVLALGVAVCVAIGAAAGLANGLMVRVAKINAVITTIAMLSILQGIALLARPTPGGMINQVFTEFLRIRIGFVPTSAIALVIAVIVGDLWLHRTRSGLETRATGFREEAARRNGVRVNWINVRAFILAGCMTAVAGLFLGSEVGVGHATVGENYALASIAAAVLGGAALNGGRGSFSGALLGALFFTLMVNVISILGLNSSVGVIASGLMTLLAVFLYSGIGEFDRLVRKIIRRRPARQMVAAE